MFGEDDFRAEVFNAALRLRLEWGENFHQPIGSRLRGLYPEITEAEAEALQQWAQEVERFAFRLIEEGYQASNGQNGGAATVRIKQTYPQIDEDNLAHLYSQGMYYAWHG